ncbi:hypothetical protein Q3G72_018715 [Acer saccharum]|nr:hypothetical protein Q3G72_018715 [Acer saccharum]
MPSDVLVSGNENWASQKPIQLVKRQFEWKSKDGKDNVEEIGDDLVSSYLNLDNIDTLNSSRKANRGESSDKEAGNRANITSMGFQFQRTSSSVPRGRRGGRKRSAAGGDIDPTGEHCRSVSMDNAATKKTQQTRVDQLSPDEKLAKLSGKFNEAELKKVLADDKLAQIALSDPKLVKRILANSESAARSKLNRVKQVAELEQKIQTKETELAEISANATTNQELLGLVFLGRIQSEPTEINGLNFHIQAIGQQAQLRNDLNDVIVTELLRLQHSVRDMASNSDSMDHDIDIMNRDIDRIDRYMAEMDAEMYLENLMTQQLIIDNENPQPPN